MTEWERKHVAKMEETKRQIGLTNSWKRKNDLKKHLNRLRKEWYYHLRQKDKQKKQA